MSTWIKICGLTTVQDAALAWSLGADALGFVFHPSSKRYCPPAKARGILEALPHDSVAVGVFYNEHPDEIVETASFVRCRSVQTYLPCVALAVRANGLAVLPAIPARELPAREEWHALCASWNGGVIVDRSRGRVMAVANRKSQGTFDSIVSMFGPQARAILAGGLCEENVVQELQANRPSGVDVASGIETAPGQKNPDKLETFIKEVRRWDAMVGSMHLAGGLSPRP